MRFYYWLRHRTWPIWRKVQPLNIEVCTYCGVRRDFHHAE